MTLPAVSSLRARLSLGLGVLSLLFLSTVGIVLDRAFQASVLRAAEERIDVYLLALVGFAEVGAGGVRVPDAQLDQRFAQPGSGLYGVVRDRAGRVAWRSDSTLGRPLTSLQRRALPRPGRITHDSLDAGALGRLRVGELGVVFQRPGQPDAQQSFLVGIDQAALDAEVGAFRHALWLGLGGVGVLLLLASYWLFRVVTRPLHVLAARVAAVERGEATALGGGWPDELAAVTAHLDQFIAQERNLRERYRTLTDDLAHSLKTPLAVLRNEIAEPAPDHALLGEQVARMETVLANRLDRVVVRPVLARGASAAAPTLETLASALRRLYPACAIEVAASADARFPGEARDLTEICGNLADNACKYGNGRVRIGARTLVASSGAVRFELTVDDDGEPIPEALRERVRQRGVRADSRRAGQGIGLAVVDDLVAGYGGELVLEDAPELGGTRVRITLPAH